jgi:hypothetical protein
MSDYTNSPEWKAWEARCQAELVPMMRNSRSVVQLVPKGGSDIKFAVELGLSIMMDKPILAIVEPGTEAPAKLRKVADKIVEADVSTEEGRMQAQAAINEFLEAQA